MKQFWWIGQPVANGFLDFCWLILNYLLFDFFLDFWIFRLFVAFTNHNLDTLLLKWW